MKLYEIAHHYRAIMAHIEENCGDLDGIEAELDACADDLTDKVDAICALIAEATAEATAYKAEADRLTDGRKRAENRSERLRQYLASNLPSDGLKTPRFALSFRRSESVRVADDLAGSYHAYTQYINRDVSYSADRAAIKAAIKAGENIPFAVIESKNNLQIK